MIYGLDEVNDLTIGHELIEIKHEPFVLKNADIGECKVKWTSEYLQSVCGNKKVKIHVCENEKMDFINKNFLYKTLEFNELIKRASSKENLNEFFINNKEKYYLRSLGEDERKDISDIRLQFPELTNDIKFPQLYDEKRFFSSVFRISSPLTRLWTHYDIMDNLLIQVSGTKKVVLFSPDDVDKLYLKGDKSQVLDIDNPDLEKYPLFAQAKRYEYIMTPGDVLFIPALWFHNVIALDFSIAVNVFWKHLDDELYEKKDLYGNKDLVGASKAFLFIDKSIKELNTLPLVYRNFYMKRCIELLKENLNS